MKTGIKKTAHGIRNFSTTIAAKAEATTHELMAGYSRDNLTSISIH